MSKKEELKARMFSLVESYKSGTESRNDFCIKNNLKVTTFSYWVTRYNRRDKKTKSRNRFVKISGTSPKPVSPLTVTLPNGVSISGSGEELIQVSVRLSELIK